MASMGDDQEENIEMWKIKKVSGPCAREEARSFFFGRVLCLFSVGESPDDDDDVAFLFFSRALSLCVSFARNKRAKRRERAFSFVSLCVSLSFREHSLTFSLSR
jgi:hypothetical protein